MPRVNQSKRQQRIQEAQQRVKALFERTPFQLVETNWKEVPEWVTRVYANNKYRVTVGDNCPTTKGPAIRAMVQANNGMIIGDHWKELQRIKNEIFGEEALAIEYYPPQSKLVDQKNIYWLWIFPAGILPEAI